MVGGFKSFFSSSHSNNQWDSNNNNNDHFNYSPAQVQTKWVEDSQSYYFKVALPGLTDKDIDVKVDDSNGDPSNPLVIVQAGVELQNQLSQPQGQQQNQQQNQQLNQQQDQSQGSNQNQGQNVPSFNSLFNQGPQPTQGFSQGLSNTAFSSQSFSSYQDQNTPYPINNYNSITSFSTNYYTAFPVPTSRIRVDDIQAAIDNGVLTVKFPKQAQNQTQGGRPVPLGKSRL